ncbi:MAG: hypothetical protein PVJ19_04735 [Desulfobacteraceae bacterium]|jgi:hypothetical protein
MRWDEMLKLSQIRWLGTQQDTSGTILIRVIKVLYILPFKFSIVYHAADYRQRAIHAPYRKNLPGIDAPSFRSKWGNFTGREFVAVTRAGNVANIYWKQNFSNTNEDFLAVLTLSEKDGRYIVERAFVDLWQLQS